MEDNKQINKVEYKYICEKCDYKCNFISQWNLHINTELHKTGKRKKRTDKTEVGQCKDCDYNLYKIHNIYIYISCNLL